MHFPNTDFSGGQVDSSLLFIDKGEAINLSGLDHSAGNLQVMKAPEQIPTASDNPLSGDVSEGFVTIRDYTTPNGDIVLVGKRGGSLWFGTQQSWRRKFLYYQKWCLDMLNSDDAGFNSILTGVTSAVNYGTVPYRLKSGNVRFFDGNSYIDTNSNDLSGTPGTVSYSVWVNPDPSALASGGYNILLATGTRIRFFMSLYYGKPYVYFTGKNSSDADVTFVAYGTTAITGGWHLFQMSWTNGAWPTLYMDGKVAPYNQVGSVDMLTGIANVTTKIGQKEYYNCFLGYMGTASCFLGAAPSDFLNQYADELPRYQSAETPVTWKPFAGGSASAGYRFFRTYLRKPEQFQQVGNNLYCTAKSAASDDYPVRWSGFWFDDGRALTDTGSGNIRLDRSWDDAVGFITLVPRMAGVRSGDTIYFAKWNTSTSKWTWDLANGRVVKNVLDSSGNNELELHDSYTTAGNGCAEFGYSANHVRYVIVRTHRAGMPDMPDITAASSATTGTLPAGKYEYVTEYGSDLTGYAGLPAISNIVTLSAAGSIQVSGWPTAVQEKDVDWIKIYRSYDDNSGSGFDTPKLVHTVSRPNIYSALTLPANWIDTGATVDSDNTLDTDCDLRSRPGAIANLIYFNDRLYGFDSSDLVSSMLGYYEYFPDEQWSATSASTVNKNIGLRVPIGSGAHDPIVAIVPEDGAYETTGIKGSDLLILLRNRAVRWFGVNLDDFDREPAFAEGGISQDFAMNAGGMIVFGSDHHVFVMASGSNSPNAVEGRRWNRGLPVSADTLKKWKCAYWNGWYLFLGTETEGNDPDTLYMFNVAKGTWTSVPGNYLDIFVPSDDPTRNVLVSDANGNVYDLFASATAQSIEYRTGRLSLESSEDEIVDVKHMRLVRMFVRPASTSDVDLTITTIGDDASNTSSNTVTVPKGTARGLVKADCPMDAVNPALKITSDNAVWPFQIDMCDVECADPHGDGTGVK